MYGNYGQGITSTGLSVKYLSPATSTAIVRCSRAHYQIVWAALTFMTHLPETPKQATLQPCVMHVVRVSGTIRKAEEEAIKRAKAAILKAKKDTGTGSSVALDAILGPPPVENKMKSFEKAADLTMSIEDDESDNDDRGSEDG
ncbi:MAG: hypothetical protein Q9219_003824 [cf. Caloplaca sp. 3 TL-2023]